MIPIGAILALCMICLLVISWQLICPKCSKKYCPKVLLETQRSALSDSANQVILNLSSEKKTVGYTLLLRVDSISSPTVSCTLTKSFKKKTRANLQSTPFLCLWVGLLSFQYVLKHCRIVN